MTNISLVFNITIYTQGKSTRFNKLIVAICSSAVVYI